MQRFPLSASYTYAMARALWFHLLIRFPLLNSWCVGFHLYCLHSSERQSMLWKTITNFFNYFQYFILFFVFNNEEICNECKIFASYIFMCYILDKFKSLSFNYLSCISASTFFNSSKQIKLRYSNWMEGLLWNHF